MHNKLVAILHASKSTAYSLLETQKIRIYVHPSSRITSEELNRIIKLFPSSKNLWGKKAILRVNFLRILEESVGGTKSVLVVQCRCQSNIVYCRHELTCFRIQCIYIDSLRFLNFNNIFLASFVFQAALIVIVEERI